jgi:hypothetical protein
MGRRGGVEALILGNAMIGWPAKPFIYEINTWVWLNTLSNSIIGA